MTAKRSRKNEHAAMRRRWHKDGTYDRLATVWMDAAGTRPCCGICEKPEPENGKLDIDHSHSTDKPLGLLCRGCNIQRPNWPAWKLRAAADYLDRAERET